MQYQGTGNEDYPIDLTTEDDRVPRPVHPLAIAQAPAMAAAPAVHQAQVVAAPGVAAAPVMAAAPAPPRPAAAPIRPRIIQVLAAALHMRVLGWTGSVGFDVKVSA